MNIHQTKDFSNICDYRKMSLPTTVIEIIQEYAQLSFRVKGGVTTLTFEGDDFAGVEKGTHAKAIIPLSLKDGLWLVTQSPSQYQFFYSIEDKKAFTVTSLILHHNQFDITSLPESLTFSKKDIFDVFNDGEDLDTPICISNVVICSSNKPMLSININDKASFLFTPRGNDQVIVLPIAIGTDDHIWEDMQIFIVEKVQKEADTLMPPGSTVVDMDQSSCTIGDIDAKYITEWGLEAKEDTNFALGIGHGETVLIRNYGTKDDNREKIVIKDSNLNRLVSLMREIFSPSIADHLDDATVRKEYLSKLPHLNGINLF